MTELEQLELNVVDTEAAYAITCIDMDRSAAMGESDLRDDLIIKWGSAQDNMLDAQLELQRFLKRIR